MTSTLQARYTKTISHLYTLGDAVMIPLTVGGDRATTTTGLGVRSEVRVPPLSPTQHGPQTQGLGVEAKIVETLLYGCRSWTPLKINHKQLRRTHPELLRRCIGWREQNPADHVICYRETLAKDGLRKHRDHGEGATDPL